ncbi:MAG: hypothetical protein LBR97_06985 [Dysgonamonadaceae bacterium]|jgi:hypothetical protein|nr:hypothetical protein [Dysgonamonadaceae bacterium]
MNNLYTSLISEIHELEQIISAIPAENVIDRMSFETRLKTVKEELARLPPQGAEAAPACLTFRGKPVFGAHGILADFGTKAATLFSDVFSMVISDTNETLSDSGPIPGKDALPLIITGTAVGSFGFEFELPPKENSLFPDLVDPAEDAIKKIENLFRLAAEGSDDDITEQIADMHHRTITKIHEFLNFMVQQEAWCGLEFGDTFFRFMDLKQIKYAASRFSDNNIQKYEEPCKGKFQGVLPINRIFEFKLSTQDDVIRGKIDRTIDKPEVINQKWLNNPVTAKFHVMKIGQGHPRYALMSLNDISN